jgi:thymidylate synthase
MQQYIDLVTRVLREGTKKENRTGVPAYTVVGATFEHDMGSGFPLLTTKRVPFGLVASELEFFIAGRTDKAWLRSRNNHIWDEWCNPERVPYGHGSETRRKMLEEDDLGPVYGYQWRRFGQEYAPVSQALRPEPGSRLFVDQLARLVETLKRDPNDRRMLVSAWNPIDLHRMALPPCHYAFQVTAMGGKLNLLWNQRSVDVALGLPFNIASYGLLLHLLAREAHLEEGTLVGFLADVHAYENHVSGLEEQVGREPLRLSRAVTERFASVFDWKFTDTVVERYEHRQSIKFEVAV